MGRVPHIDFVCAKAISKRNALMKFYRNLKGAEWFL